MIIDNKGRIFGKINLIDAIVILLILGAIPIFYYGYKVMIREPRLASRLTYTLWRRCPNCGDRLPMQFERGKPIPELHTVVCPTCLNKLVMVEVEPECDYMLESHQLILAEDLPLIKQKNKWKNKR